ncbi:MAG TPA: hypothetical protein DDW30_06870 [Clostridiales bacterium]|nr:hypothetical protein [Clostridiales bacterium]
MRMILKHWFRTVLRAPLRPLLILVIVAFSAAVATVSFKTSQAFVAHSRSTLTADRELGDILITPRGDSTVRVLYADDVQDVIGADGTVFGALRLPGILPGEDGDELVTTSAVDFAGADAFYCFRYTEYGRFTEENLSESAIISTGFSRRHQLRVGMPFTLSVLGGEYTFTVQAIAEPTGLLSDSDLLISTGRIAGELVDRFPELSGLERVGIPATRLAVRLNPDADAQALMQALAAHPVMADKTVVLTAATERTPSWMMIQLLSVWLPAGLLLLLTVLLLWSALKMLSCHRSAEYALFRICGASPAQLQGMQLFEGLLYGLVGGAAGVCLAKRILLWLEVQYGWNGLFFPDRACVLVGMLWAPALTLASVGRHLAVAKKQPADGTSVQLQAPSVSTVLVPFTGVLVCVAAMLFLEVRLRYLLAVPAVFLFLWFVYAVLPPILRWLAHRAVRVTEQRRRPSAAVWLVSNNLRSSFPARHTCRILTLLLALFLTVTACVRSIEAQTDSILDIFSADCVAANANDRTEELLRAREDVSAVLRFSFFSEVNLSGGVQTMGFSLRERESGCMNTDALPLRLPEGAEIALSQPIAELLGVTVGDPLEVKVQGVTAVLTVSETMESRFPIVFLDAAALGLQDNLICVRFRSEDADRTRSRAVSEQIRPTGSVLVDCDTVFGTMRQTVENNLALLRFFFGAAAVISPVGCVQMLLTRHRERKRELPAWRAAGMSNGGFVGMRIWEVTASLLLAVVFSVPVSYALCRLLQTIAQSFGVSLF